MVLAIVAQTIYFLVKKKKRTWGKALSTSLSPAFPLLPGGIVGPWSKKNIS
jgi:hypothetical protein